MTNVHTDLEALIDFRAHLIRFDQLLSDEFASINDHFRSLRDGNVWNDPKAEEFDSALAEVNRGITRYLETAPEHEDHLRRLIQTIEDFLNTRLR